MAIELKLPTREQVYTIYAGSAGFTKIIQATGLVDTELTTDKILQAISDLDRRKAIVSVLLDEGEFEPELDFSTERKRETLTLKLAKQLDLGWIMKLVASLVRELNEAATELSAAIPAIASQPDFIQDAAIAPQPDLIQEAAIAHSLISTDGEIFTQSNITEGE